MTEKAPPLLNGGRAIQTTVALLEVADDTLSVFDGIGCCS